MIKFKIILYLIFPKIKPNNNNKSSNNNKSNNRKKIA